MADAETTEAPESVERTADTDPHEHDPVHEHAHPSPATYVGVGIILAIVTAVEIGLFYVDEDDVSTTVITLSLIVLMVIKFFLVAMWFMHLKFEAPIFRRLFYGGAVLAVAAFAVVLGASHVFPILV